MFELETLMKTRECDVTCKRLHEISNGSHLESTGQKHLHTGWTLTVHIRLIINNAIELLFACVIRCVGKIVEAKHECEIGQSTQLKLIVSLNEIVGDCEHTGASGSHRARACHSG